MSRRTSRRPSPLEPDDVRFARRRLVVAVVLGLLLTGRAGSADDTAAFAIATSPSTFGGSVPLEILKRMLSGQIDRWPDGAPVKIVLLPKDSPPMHWMCETLLGVSEKSYRRFLLEKAFRGELERPIETSSVGEAVTRTGDTKGSLAPLPLSTLGSSVRKVETN